MNFEYNGNLEESKRVLQVAEEIVNYYPEITLETAKIIASLEEPITTEVNSVMCFKRLYNILFIIQNNTNIFLKIYNDIVNTYNLYLTSNNNDEILNRMMEELSKYVNKKRIDFPIISEFY